MLRIGILVFDDVEVLDACGPFEVFSVAGRAAERAGREAPFEVVLIAAGAAGLVRARGGLPLQVEAGLAEAPALDVLLVPGGVTDAVEQDTAVVAWVAERARVTPYVVSVCTGAFVLAEAGVVTDQSVTTHWDDIVALRERWPALDVLEEVRWVHAQSSLRPGGEVYTSAGISAGIDLALHLVEVLDSRDNALATARLMDYAWTAT
ncbi:DJ-1/PfpI family protein [Nocardioides sp.]|uniref:DJ-1/PfpI family protein n=1 Tax=Nocardioides sp. TaxID=35761 RepID=UPI002B27015F|nr:DJ-1/PfpI family protein [Nocardioides sp.]